MEKKTSWGLHAKILVPSIWFLFVVSSLGAQSIGVFDPKENVSKEFTIGFGIYSAPSYEGATEYTTRAAPFFNFKYHNILVNPINGVRANLISWKNWSGGVGLGASFGRNTKQDNHLLGLGNIAGTLETILFAKYKAHFYSINGALYTDVLKNGHEGSYLKASLDTGFPIIDIGTFVRPSLSMTFADKDYLDSFFGVSPTQSISSGYPEYALSHGLKDIAANLLIIIKINNKMSLSSTLTYKKLMAKVATSPVVQKDDLFSGGISLNYRY